MSNRHFHRRYQSVEMEPMDDSSDNSNQTWLQDGLNSMQLKRSEMNELIMDYLVHEGFKEAAERFREEAGIESANLRSNAELNRSEKSQSNGSNNASRTTTNESVPPSINNGTNNSSNNNAGSANHTNNNSINNGKLDEQRELTQMIGGQAASDNSMETSGVEERFKDWLTKVETPEMMDRRVEVRHLIEEGNILRGQALINLYYPELLDNHKNLCFKLQQQHLIELIRLQKINEVLAYVHDQLSVDELKDLTEMERTLALLAYEHPDKSPYAGLLQISHRLQLASEINDIILQETTGNVEPTKPRLVTLLKLLFWTQSQLERKKIQFPKMTDLVNGTILEPRHI